MRSTPEAALDNKKNKDFERRKKVAVKFFLFTNCSIGHPKIMAVH